jgi:hypothetical protein
MDKQLYELKHVILVTGVFLDLAKVAVKYYQRNQW